MDSSARIRSSDLCCRQFVQTDFAATCNGAAAADSWDSAMSNSPVDDFGAVGNSGWWNGGGSGGGGGGLACFGCPLGSYGGGGRFAEVSVADEGFLDCSTANNHRLATGFHGCEDRKLLDEAYDDDDLESSVSSNGSEILQMVDQLLLAFNLEVEAAAAAADAQTESADVLDLVSASGLAAGLFATTDEEVPDADDDAASDLQTDDDEAYWEADSEDQQPVMYFFKDADSLDGGDADNEASSSVTSASANSAASAEPPAAFLATGLFRLPQEAVLEAMDYWGPLDRIRWLLWRPEPCPPRPETQQQQQQPIDKSKRACSFLLKGRCRKEDCEFAHDLSRVTCKFWAAGQCFKGSGCPFLHGYAD